MCIIYWEFYFLSISSRDLIKSADQDPQHNESRLVMMFNHWTDLKLEDHTVRVSSVLYIPIYSYIWKTVLYIPIYSYIWNTVLYIPIFQGKQEMLNSYLKQMLLISKMKRCKFVILQHLMSYSHFFQVWQPCPAQPSHYIRLCIAMSETEITMC